MSSSSSSPKNDNDNNVSSSNTTTTTSFFEPKTKQILSTQFGGFVSTLTFYPIDTIRTRTMSHDNTTTRLHHNNSIRYQGILRPLSNVIEHEGVLALYRGSHVAVGGATASWGIYMYLYKTLQEISSSSLSMSPSFLLDCTTSTAASVGNCFLTTPVWHVKTRMQLEDTTNNTKTTASSTTSSSSSQKGTPTATQRKYRGFFKSLIAVHSSDGFAGLWRGFSPQLLMSVVNGVYFPVYQQVLENVRRAREKDGHHHSVSSIVSFSSSTTKTTSKGNDNNNNSNTKKDPLSKPATWEVAVASAGAKTLINLFSNPLFVVRTRLQDERHSNHAHIRYQNLMQSIGTIFKQEGVLGFYKGLRAGLLVTAPKSVMTMVVAEYVYHRF